MSSYQKQVLSHFPLCLIKFATENDLIYDPFGVANEDDLDLVNSIADKGIQEPLVISKDNYLLSGHRRSAAAKHLRLVVVPVRKLDINFEALNKEERLKLLRTFNQQRNKSPGERIREKILEIDPKIAHSKLLERRRAIENIGESGESNIVMGAKKPRAAITTLQFLQRVQEIINANRIYWPLTDRRVHYLLLNNPPLKHDKKPHSVYTNNKQSYKSLTNLLIRARLSGSIPMNSIEDTTRPIQLGGGFGSVEQFIENDLDRLFCGYSRNLMQGQPHHIEIILEKNALRSVIEVVAREYCIPVTTTRGYASLSPRNAIYQRFKRSGKEKLVVLLLTDFDPDGEQIAESLVRSLRDDFGISNIHPVKVALTNDDVQKYDLPSDMDAKPESPNYKKFVDKYGTKAVELDAAPVELLQEKLREAIKSVIDIDEFNEQLELEEADAVELEARRDLTIELIKGSI